jgi:hypothetical protein
VQALQTTLTPAQLKEVSAVTSFDLSIRQDRSIMKKVLCDVFGQISEGELSHIGDLEIIVRAARNSSVKRTAEKINTQKITAIVDEASIKFKGEVKGAVEEAFLIGSGAISLVVTGDISSALVEAATNNTMVQERVNEFQTQVTDHADIQKLLGTANPSASVTCLTIVLAFPEHPILSKLRHQVSLTPLIEPLDVHHNRATLVFAKGSNEAVILA